MEEEGAEEREDEEEKKKKRKEEMCWQWIDPGEGEHPKGKMRGCASTDASRGTWDFGGDIVSRGDGQTFTGTSDLQLESSETPTDLGSDSSFLNL